jgi:hypothetical protein
MSAGASFRADLRIRMASNLGMGCLPGQAVLHPPEASSATALLVVVAIPLNGI